MSSKSKVIDYENGDETKDVNYFKKSYKTFVLATQRKKRYHSASFSHFGSNDFTIDGLPCDIYGITTALNNAHLSGNRLPYGKNSKKSRNGRKFPSKKGGKNYNDPSYVLDEIELAPDDPDYDSDANASVVFDELRPFEEMFYVLFDELFEHGNTKDVVDALLNANLAIHQLPYIPYLAIVSAIQRNLPQCELTSRLLLDCFNSVIQSDHVRQGFELLLDEMSELIIDVPRASEYIGRFLARAIGDKILDFDFIKQAKFKYSTKKESSMQVNEQGDSVNSDLVGQFDESVNGVFIRGRPTLRNLSDSSNGGSTSLDTYSSGIGSASSLSVSNVSNFEMAMKTLLLAENLLSGENGVLQLDDIWGVPNQLCYTANLANKFANLLNVYVQTGNIGGAIKSLKELESPHFHHELVFQLVVMAIRSPDASVYDRLFNLLHEFCQSAVITVNQLTLGINRVYSNLTFIRRGIPKVHTILERFLNKGIKAGFIPNKLLENIPSKQRRRFISETNSICKFGQF